MSEIGYRAPQVCKLVGITYRQLDYWTRTGLLTPSIATAHGAGSQRLYSFSDIVQLKVVKRLIDAAMSLKRVRQAIELLRASDTPLADVTLLWDGDTIYAAKNPDEVLNAFRGGAGVIGIAVGPVQAELEGEIHRLFPGEEAEPAAPAIVARRSASAFVDSVADEVRRRLQELQDDRRAAGESLASLGGPSVLADRLLAAVPSYSTWDERIGPFFSGRAVAARLGGITRQAVADRRSRGSLLGMRTTDGVWIYPTWQFLDSGEVKPGLSRILRPFAVQTIDGWEVAAWLESTFKSLGGASPRQYFEGGGDIERLGAMAVRAAARLAA